MKRHGFTLIELLIVIALLGTLAVALLAAIDPFEQFRKGQDTGTRNTVQEIFNASIRYYALQNSWPASWTGGTAELDEVGQAFDTWEILTGTTVTGNELLDPLISAGELKDNFIKLAEGSLDNIFIMQRFTTEPLNESHIAVCYMPQSNSFQEADRNTQFEPQAPGTVGSAPYYENAAVAGQPIIDDPEAAVCRSNGAVNNCYWCVH